MLSIIPAFLIFFSSFLQDPSGSWIPSSKSSKTDFYIKSKYVSKVDSKITIWTKQVGASGGNTSAASVAINARIDLATNFTNQATQSMQGNSPGLGSFILGTSILGFLNCQQPLD